MKPDEPVKSSFLATMVVTKVPSKAKILASMDRQSEHKISVVESNVPLSDDIVVGGHFV